MRRLLDTFLISGIPGSGKTTVARLLAESFERGVHIEGDLVGHEFIASGLVAPHEEPREEAERQLNLRRRNITLLANSFLESRFVVVVDDVILSWGVLDFYRRDLQGRLHFVQLCPAIEVVQKRDAGRHKQVFGIWGHLQQELERMDRIGLWIDTSAMKPADVLATILGRSEEAFID